MNHTHGIHSAVIPTVAGHQAGLVAGFAANAYRCAGSFSDVSSKCSDAADSMRSQRESSVERGRLRTGWSGWQGTQTQPTTPPVTVPVVPVGQRLPAPAWAALVLSRSMCG
jgi:hypothetical protein